MMRIKLVTDGRQDFLEVVTLECRAQLFERGLDAFTHRLKCLLLERQCSFKTITHRNKTLCERFDCKLARLGHLILRSSSYVFSFCVCTQQHVVLVCQFSLQTLNFLDRILAVI